MIERAGCDINPLDPADSEDRLRLLSYVWADQLLDAAVLDAASAARVRRVFTTLRTEVMAGPASEPEARRAASAGPGLAVALAVLAVALYYAHFGDAYRTAAETREGTR